MWPVGVLRVLRFSLPILIPPTAPHASFSIRVWYSRAISRQRNEWTQSQEIKKLSKTTKASIMDMSSLSVVESEVLTVVTTRLHMPEDSTIYKSVALTQN
jgi:hypothetical protein